MSDIIDYPLKEPVEQRWSIATMTLAEALQNGQIFKLDDFRDEIEESLDWESVPEKDLQLYVDLIQKYDGLYEAMSRYDPNGETAREIAKRYQQDQANQQDFGEQEDSLYTVPNAVQARYTFATGKLLPSLDVDRMNALSLLPDEYIFALYTIYNVGSVDQIIEIEPSKFEQFVIDFQKVPLDKVDDYVASIGMIIPPTIEDKKQYVLNQLINYKNVDFDASDYKIPTYVNSLKDFIISLDPYSDQRIVEMFGYHGPYDTRMDYIANVEETINEGGFYTIVIDRTEVGVDGVDGVDGPTSELRFGNLGSEDLRYSIDELLDNFTFDDEPRYVLNNGPDSIVFHYPDDERIFTLKQVGRLPNLLSTMATVDRNLTELIKPLIERVELGMMQNSRRSVEIEDCKAWCREDTEQWQAARDLSNFMFYAGQYIDGWQGVGTPYVDRMSTQVGPINNGKIVRLLELAREALGKLEVQDIQVIDYQHGVLIFRIMTIGELLDTVLAGNPVHNVSHYLKVSGYYYSVLLCNELLSVR